MATRLDAPWPGGITADLHRLLLADFVASLREGRTPAVDGAGGLRIQRLIDAIYAAAASGSRTAIPG
jgi:predicted dehydrogenase